MTDIDAISEIVSTVLIIILVIALAAVMAALFFGVLDLTGKSAFIAPNLEMQNIGGKNVIVMENRAGDTAFLNVTGHRQYEMGIYVDSATGSARATPVGSEDAFSPGSRLYLYDSAGGYRITGSLADISGSEVRSITACPVSVRLVDENANILIVTRSLPCSGSPTPTGPAPGPVSADFKASPVSGEAPLGVQFTDLSTGPVLAWNWAFGDGNTSTGRHPSHTYATGGSYAVSLTVSNGTGTNSLSRANYIAVTVPPVKADFSATPTTGSKPLTVYFTDASTGPVNRWFYDFGDGHTCNERNCPKDTKHTYTKAGTYTVSLTVWSSSGSDTLTRTNYITIT
jgi:PKD repeat protein